MIPSVTASEQGSAQSENPFRPPLGHGIVISRGAASGIAEISFLEKNIREGENPVLALLIPTYGALS